MAMSPFEALERAEHALDTIASQRDNAMKDRDRATLTIELLQRDLAQAEARIEDLERQLKGARRG